MSLLNKLTIKNLKLNKKRTIVTIIGIVLSVSLITVVASIYSSGIKSLIKYEAQDQGNFHAAFYDVPTKDLDVFEENREIENLSITKDIGYAKVNSKNESKPYAYVKAFTKNSLENLSIKLVKGRLPQNSDEIVIPTHLKTNGRLVLSVGDTITLDIGKRISLTDNVELHQDNPYQFSDSDKEIEDITDTVAKTYKIVGIIERPAANIESYSAPGYTFITYMNDDDLSQNVDIYARYTKDGTKKAYKLTANILGVDENLFEKYYSGEGTFDEMEKYSKEEASKAKYDINMNTYLIGLETNPIDSSPVVGLGTVVFIVIAIIIFTSVFCIKNSFDISITEKTKQYGMLRSIGATKRQIKNNVFYEATILGLIGIPLGIICGIGASALLIFISNYFLKSTFSIKLYFQFSWISVLIAALLGIITIYFSAFRSAKRASKISPIDSIRNSSDIKISAKKLKSPKIIKKLFGMGGEISYKNLKRNKKKYRTTLVSLIVSISVFIALTGFMNLIFDVINNELSISEYNVSLSTTDIKVNEQEKFNRYIDTTKLDNIEDYTLLRSVNLSYKNRKFNPEYVDFLNLELNEEVEEDAINTISIFTLGTDQYKKYIKKLGLDYDEIKDKGILMDYIEIGYQNADEKEMKYKTMRLFDYQKGDVLSGTLDNDEDFKIEIGCVTDVKPFGLKDNRGEYLIVSDELYNKIATYDSAMMLNIYYKSSNANKLQDDIDEMLNGELYHLSNIEEDVKSERNLFTLAAIFLYGFIIVISLIGITNIFNTITTNMELRRQEFAMLKSVGMTKKEFNRMIRLESLFLGLKALIIGIPIGILLSYIMYYFLVKGSSLAFKIPILTIIISIITVFLLILLIMKYSISKINKQNTIETIRNENI